MASIIGDDDKVDTVCSALAINCCQFGCFVQNTPRIPCASENNEWMTKLTEIAPKKKLRDLVMPGTHDSASSTIAKWRLFSAVGLCQNVTVTEQLQRGARYIDIRIGSGAKESTLMEDVHIVHGILKGGKFSDIVEEVDQFISDNPGEFVVMEVVLEYQRELSPEQRIGVLKLLNTTFGERMISKEDGDSWFKVKEVTLEDLSQKNKNMLLLLHDRICGFSHEGTTYDMDTVKSTFNCHKNESCMKNKWHNTMDTQFILDSNAEFLESNCKVRGKLVNSQFVMTPAFGGVENVPGLLTGWKSLRPISLARKLYRKDVLETFLRDKAEDGWNIVLLDFVDLCPLLVRFLIGLNSPKKLTIQEAKATPKDGRSSTDVSAALEELIKRENTLYLLDFQNDLKLDYDEGELILKAQFGEESVEHAIPFDKETEFLLCDESFMCENCH